VFVKADQETQRFCANQTARYLIVVGSELSSSILTGREIFWDGRTLLLVLPIVNTFSVNSDLANENVWSLQWTAAYGRHLQLCQAGFPKVSLQDGGLK